MPNWYACFHWVWHSECFAGREKIRALRLVKQQTSYQEMFKQLGMKWVLSDMLFQSLQEYTCNIHVTLMSWGTGYSAPRRVTSTPPNYHLVSTVCSSMRFAQTSKQSFGSEVCKAAKGREPHWFWLARRRWSLCHWLVMSGDPAPTTVLKLLSCSCTSSCQLATCSCLANGLKCTDVYKLLDCDNRCEDSIEEFVSDDSEDDEEI